MWNIVSFYIARAISRMTSLLMTNNLAVKSMQKNMNLSVTFKLKAKYF